MNTSMAKRTTSQWSWQWPIKIRAISLSVGCLAVCGLGSLVRAADSVPSRSPPTNAITVRLEYQEAASAVNYWGVSVRAQTNPFPKEPAAVPGKTFRGVLNFGGNSSNSIPFVWQRDARKLFLDLNRDRDLTNDAAGVFSARVASSIDYQTFTNVHLLFNTASGRCPLFADVSFYAYSAQPNCEFMVRSFWQGRVTLNGRDWQVGIVQNDLKQSDSLGNSQLLLRPWETRSRPFTTSDGTLATVSFSRKLFVDGHAYQLNLETQSPDGEVKPALRFTEQSVALGEVKITGKFIQRLVLWDGPNPVVLDEPAGTVAVPIGSYGQPSVLLQQGGTKAYQINYSRPASSNWVSVNSNTPVVLNVGGPLTNSVIATREGQDLRLNYRLIGAGGATYRLVNLDSSKPPTFAIYKGDRKIASDNFQFG
jgi:hypothetical protein